MTGVTDSQMMEGIWWLPETPGHRVAGSLAINATGGAELSLIGSLTSFLDGGVKQVEGDTTTISFTEASLARSGRYRRILGLSGQNHVTLENCLQAHWGGIFGGVESERIHIGLIFVGHFEVDEETRFTAVNTHMDHLIDWLQLYRGEIVAGRGDSPQPIKASSRGVPSTCPRLDQDASGAQAIVGHLETHRVDGREVFRCEPAPDCPGESVTRKQQGSREPVGFLLLFRVAGREREGAESFHHCAPDAYGADVPACSRWPSVHAERHLDPGEALKCPVTKS